MTNKDRPEQAPLNTEPGAQKDDNIDDLGRRSDGQTQDQPVHPEKRQPDKADPADPASDKG